MYDILHISYQHSNPFHYILVLGSMAVLPFHQNDFIMTKQKINSYYLNIIIICVPVVELLLLRFKICLVLSNALLNIKFCKILLLNHNVVKTLLYIKCVGAW